MKIALVLCTIVIAAAFGISLQPRPQEIGLKNDLKQLGAIIPEDRLKSLLWRYLLNDAEFQAIVRYANSAEARSALRLLALQPESLEVSLWTKAQLAVESSESTSESAEEICFQKTANLNFPLGPPTAGWAGFVQEFAQIYPSAALQILVRSKVRLNGIFAQFWAKVQAVKLAYERTLAIDEFKQFSANLTALGVNVTQIDRFIRDQYWWN